MPWLLALAFRKQICIRRYVLFIQDRPIRTVRLVRAGSVENNCSIISLPNTIETKLRANGSLSISDYRFMYPLNSYD